jgi:hypothetical protein
MERKPMMNLKDMTRNDLESEILCDDGELWAAIDEPKLLLGDTPGGYTTEELREIVSNWINNGDECAGS